jgi:hypothetical protein
VDDGEKYGEFYEVDKFKVKRLPDSCRPVNKKCM